MLISLTIHFHLGGDKHYRTYVHLKTLYFFSFTCFAISHYFKNMLVNEFGIANKMILLRSCILSLRLSLSLLAPFSIMLNSKVNLKLKKKKKRFSIIFPFFLSYLPFSFILFLYFIYRIKYLWNRNENKKGKCQVPIFNVFP